TADVATAAHQEDGKAGRVVTGFIPLKRLRITLTAGMPCGYDPVLEIPYSFRSTLNPRLPTTTPTSNLLRSPAPSLPPWSDHPAYDGSRNPGPLASTLPSVRVPRTAAGASTTHVPCG